MAIITILKVIKQIHPTEIILVKIGDFYHVYGKDAYILSYLFKYKMKIIEDDIPSCGFPVKILPKIETKLENEKINYLLVDRRNNYEVDEFVNYKNLNTYDEKFKKAYYHVNLKNRLDNIYEYLFNNLTKESTKNIIKEIEMKIK